jgi:hypothetical protein
MTGKRHYMGETTQYPHLAALLAKSDTESNEFEANSYAAVAAWDGPFVPRDGHCLPGVNARFTWRQPRITTVDLQANGQLR